MLNMFFGLRCPDCGKKISEDDSLCPHCGSYLDVPLGEAESHSMAQKYLVDAQSAYDSGMNIKSALVDIDTALQFEPELAEAHNLRGLILDAMGKTGEAIKSYQEAVRLNPDLDEAKANLGDAEAEYHNEDVNIRNSFSTPKDNAWPKVLVGLVGILLILSVVLGLGFIYIIGRDYLAPKTTVIFEPDYSQVSKVDFSILEKTAAILTTRAHDLGYPRVSFIATKDSQIVGEIPGYIDTIKLVEKISPIGLLEFVDFGLNSLPEGAVVNTDVNNLYFPQTDEKQLHTIMTNADIAYATVAKSQADQYMISFSLTDDAGKIFADYTFANVGTYLGIVLDKVVISSPIINQSITGGQGQISGNFTQESAQDLAIILRTTPLPIPIKLVQNGDSGK